MGVIISRRICYTGRGASKRAAIKEMEEQRKDNRINQTTSRQQGNNNLIILGFGSVAQLVEQQPFKLMVMGPNPIRPKAQNYCRREQPRPSVGNGHGSESHPTQKRV